MRKVFLDDLPRWGSGTNKGKIKWSDSVGCEIPFIYDDIHDKFKLIDYKKEKCILTAEYNGNIRKLYSEDIKKCRICSLIQKRNGEFKIDIGETLKDKKRDLIITDREYRFKEQKPDKKGRVYTTREKWYKYTCNKCGWTEGWIRESALIVQDNGCSCCNGKTVVPEINSIYAKAPWMMKWISEEDAKNHTVGEKERIKTTCPDCGREKTNIVSDIYNNKSIGCTCGDGYSYGHKYVYSLLRQLGVDFEEEVSFEWCKFYNKYRERFYKVKYDFVIEDDKLIIEVDGDFHRMDNNMSGQSKEESEFIDSEKDRLARENGYKVIRIFYDSLNVEIEKHIRSSELNEIFNLESVDTYFCEEFALNNNKIKDVCNYWNNKENWETTGTLAKEFNTNKNTIRKYLSKGTKLGWINYNPEEEAERIRIQNANTNKITRIKTVEVFKDGDSLGIFRSLSELSNVSEDVFGVRLQCGNISLVCNGKKPQYKGFTFKYVENNE
ncbi:hypothetical protein [Clostridium cuniculi]|uniref:hypothetical protein n=1 Tax=Clostridium cuniculi TaxID=2548455 RepID=UPI0010548D0A|nr:hypothetical protein [Clostridium cuniculi]